jgi:hypothetical protein
MNQQHQQLAAGRWQKLSFFEQMANIGSEVERAIKWKNKNNVDYSRQAFERALELLDLSIGSEKNKKRLKEMVRLREALADYFVFENSYKSSDQKWQNYFYGFNFAARLRR